MTLLAGFLLLGILIFIHELGHFVVAKLSGVRVLTFSLGFGPRLFGITVGHTDYRISAIPLGGYVRMFGDDLREEISEEEKQFSFLHQPIPQKAAIAFAGPAANFLLPIVIFFAANLGTEQVPEAVVGTVLAGEAADRAGLKRGDRIVRAGDQPIDNFIDLLEVIQASPGVEVALVVENDGKERAVTVVPKSVASLHPLKKGEVRGQIGLMPTVVLAHVDVLPGSAAAQAGLRAADEILRLNGEAVQDGEGLLARLDALGDEAWTLEVKRRDQSPKDASDPQTETSNDQTSNDQTSNDQTSNDQTSNDQTSDEQAKEPPATITIEIPVAASAAPTLISPIRRYAVSRNEIDDALARRIALTRSVLEQRAVAIAARRGIGLAEGVVMQIQEKTTATALDLAAGDRILAVDGISLQFADDLQRRLGPENDRPHVIGVRDGAEYVVMLFRQSRSPERGLEDFRVFGATLGHAFGHAPMLERKVGPAEAFIRALDKTWDLISMTAKGLWMLVTFQVSFKSLGGPITIFSLAGEAMEFGFDRFAYLMCFISVNLGLMNLLPVPVLDGGHLLLFGLEAVRRKDLELATKERALQAGFILLMALMVAAIFNDVMRLIG